MLTINEQKTVGQRSYETELVIARLREAIDGEDYSIITYEELARIGGSAIRRRLPSIRHQVGSEHRRLFGIVPTIGIKLLTVDEQAALPDSQLRKTRSAAKRHNKELSLVQYSQLSESQRARFNVAASVHGAIEVATKADSITRLEGAVQQAGEKLAIGDTLKLFGG